MLHDRYDNEIEYAIRTLDRDNDETGTEGFWDLAGRIVGELNTYSEMERQELLYNAFHKIAESMQQEVVNKDKHKNG